MKRVCVLATVLIGILLSPVLATAQERGQVGITMGYPSAIGLQWQATDRLALRPEISFSFFSSDVETNILFVDEDDLERNGHTFSTAVSAIWYLRPATDNIRTYISPRLSFGQAGGSESPDSSAWSLAGSFGAQYTPARRFAIFAEAGYGFTSSDSDVESPIGNTSTTTKSWSTRTAVGVIFYFQ